MVLFNLGILFSDRVFGGLKGFLRCEEQDLLVRKCDSGRDPNFCLDVRDWGGGSHPDELAQERVRVCGMVRVLRIDLLAPVHKWVLRVGCVVWKKSVDARVLRYGEGKKSA